MTFATLALAIMSASKRLGGDERVEIVAPFAQCGKTSSKGGTPGARAVKPQQRA
jgi:hypothetical protein